MDPEYFALEVGATWIVLNEEFGNTPEGRAKLDKFRWLKGEIVFDEIQKKLKTPAGDPYTAGKAISDYLRAVGSSDTVWHKISNTEFLYEMKRAALEPIHARRSDEQAGFDQLKPLPTVALFRAALKRLCNMQVEVVPVTDEMRATTLKGMRGSLLRLSPIK